MNSKEEIDSQFWYPRRNRVIKEYKNIKDNYSWSGEDDSELVYTEPVKSIHSPKIYELRTPLKTSKGKDNTEVILSSDSSSDFGKKAKRSYKLDKAISTSSINTSVMVQNQVAAQGSGLSLVDVIFLEETLCTKCSKVGESHCYNISIMFGHLR